MKKTIVVLTILITTLLNAQTIKSVQKGYFNAVVEDSVLANRTTERKAKDDGINYALKHGLKSYLITFPDYVKVTLDGFEKDTVVVVIPDPIDDVITDSIITPIDTTTMGNVYKLNPNKSGIIQGIVSDAMAMKNKEILNRLITEAKTAGYNTFKIDALDAYFKVNGDASNASPVQQAIRLPSNFSLIMTDNTHLRVQPNNYRYTTLLSVYMDSNVTIEGGTLHGDRDEHDYSSGGTHEWGHLFTSRGGVNVTLKNVVMIDATGDGLDIQGEYHATDPRYAPTKNFLATGCKFIRSRRNNVSITSCDGVVIDDCDFIDAGIDTEKSKGTAPKYALDVEALQPTELAINIVISNNREHGSAAGGFLVAIGDLVTIENNYAENSIGISSGSDCIVRNNVIIAKSDISISAGLGISTGRTDRPNAVGNQVYGNTVTGFATGIAISNTNSQVYGNTIHSSARGIYFNNADSAQVYNNTVISENRNNSDGVVVNGFVRNSVFKDNIIKVNRSALRLTSVNQQSEDSGVFTLENNKFTSNSYSILSKVSYLSLKDNLFNNSLQFFDNSNIVLLKNTITTTSATPGIYLRNVNTDFLITDNIITSPLSNCITINSTTNLETITTENNTCN